MRESLKDCLDAFDGRIRTFAAYVLRIHLSLPLVLFLVKRNNKSVSEVPGFRVGFLSIVYHCPIHNLPTFIDTL